jgi:DNA-directed RNA polymerase, sigma subunit (sigma70/sigma32)
MARTATLPVLNGESGLSRYLAEIRKFPMLEPQQEYMLAKRWREHDDRDAAHHLVTSHLRLVAKIAMGYRGYGLPISEVVSEGNVGLMQAVKRFEPERAFARHLRHVVDQGVNTRVHPAFVVAREDGHHREPEEAVLQPAQGEEQDLRAGRG